MDMRRSVYKYIKRSIDVVIAYFLLIFAYPAMAVIALLIRIVDGGGVIFRQVRVGQGERPFICYKFRTMRQDAPSELSTEEFVNASDYITPLGAFLRRTSLDELPQLFNVLAGDMSIIGPRPLIRREETMHELRRYAGVYSLRPGITGLAQICGRDSLNDSKKALCDAVYVKGISLRTDIYIFFSTLMKIFRAEGGIRLQ